MHQRKDIMKHRTGIHVYLTQGAHDWWHGTADEEGTTVSALFQAIADAGVQAPDERVLSDKVVRLARRISAQRRRRSNRD